MTETDNSILLLSAAQLTQKVKRMAYEILEANFGEKELVFAGICEQGELLAKQLAKHLDEISSIRTVVTRIDLEKSHPFRQAMNNIEEDVQVANKVVIMVDDVLYTGKTIAYGLKPFLSKKIKKIEVAVLVDRSHTAFPIKATYIGYELSTTLSDNIQVNLKGKKGVYLN